jgi:predicted dehydrogenase
LGAAEAVARPTGAAAHDSFTHFLDDVDAVAFAVPPDVQCVLAAEAARAGKALLLEKPIALTLADAEALSRVVDEEGVPTQMVLTWRYVDEVRAFLAEVAGSSPVGGRGHFLTGGLLGGIFATPWRTAHGPLLDLGPHVIDLLDAALGPVVGIRAHGDPLGWVGLLLDHADGMVSEASLTAISGFGSASAGVEVHTTDRVLEVATTGVSASAMTTLVDEFVATARDGVRHPLDIHRGLHLQYLLAAALADLRDRRRGAG